MLLIIFCGCERVASVKSFPLDPGRPSPQLRAASHETLDAKYRAEELQGGDNSAGFAGLRPHPREKCLAQLRGKPPRASGRAARRGLHTYNPSPVAHRAGVQSEDFHDPVADTTWLLEPLAPPEPSAQPDEQASATLLALATAESAAALHALCCAFRCGHARRPTGNCQETTTTT